MADPLLPGLFIMKLKSLCGSIMLFFFVMGSSLEACPVCFQSNGEESRWAFYATTVLLTCLPLSLVGGAVLWLRKRFNQMKNELVN